MKIFQKGFNFSQDGPGNRLVYHIAGCNMRCRWCSNPEGMTGDGDFTDYTPEDIVREGISCKMMFFDGGGVTFTGGEATLDADELIEALKGLKENGIHTSVETNGTSKRLFDIIKYVDYLIMDFKHFDDDILKRYTGVDTTAIKENYKKICESGRQCHIRIPLVNEFNAAFPKEFAEYLSGYNTDNIVFEFLAYHEYGKEKWKDDYKIKDGFVSLDTIKNFKNEFENRGLKIITT